MQVYGISNRSLLTSKQREGQKEIQRSVMQNKQTLIVAQAKKKKKKERYGVFMLEFIAHCEMLAEITFMWAGLE